MAFPLCSRLRFSLLTPLPVIAGSDARHRTRIVRLRIARYDRSRNDGASYFLRHLLRALPEHVLARLLVERLLDELADRKPRLHLRPGADLGVPALDVRIIVERKALRLVGHGPGKAGDVGDRIVAGDIGCRSCPVAYRARDRAAPPRRGSARSRREFSPAHRARNGRAGRASDRARSSATSPIA